MASQEEAPSGQKSERSGHVGSPLEIAVSREFVIASWREEHTSLGSTVHDKMKQVDQVFSVVAVVLGILVTVAASNQLRFVYLALPSLLLIVVIYTIRNYQEIVAIGVYRRHLERLMELWTGVPLARWEHFSPKWNQYSLGNLAAISTIFLFAFGSAVAGSFAAFAQSAEITVTFCIITYSLVAIVIASGLEHVTKARRVDRDLRAFRVTYGLEPTHGGPESKIAQSTGMSARPPTP